MKTLNDYTREFDRRMGASLWDDDNRVVASLGLSGDFTNRTENADSEVRKALESIMRENDLHEEHGGWVV